IYLARACETLDGRLVTLEIEKTLAARARANFQRAGLEHRIEVIVGDALDEMSAMNGPFDLIFLDIDKEFYLDVLTHCRRLLKKGGLLVADNVGFEEADNFNRAIFNSPEWETVHLLSFLPFHSPEHDGLCLATRI
ncbi:MAG: class I SAM-dependent methyltransferase, partial [Deltaproteobacteria bacterium]|nr:class I SAM-dependent methyltransferase [Deltaproteobacteria bacterium]